MNIHMIGKYGPVIKYEKDGEVEFKNVKKDIDVNKLKNGEYELKDLLVNNNNKSLNNVLGRYKDNDVILKKGRYGLYVNYNSKNYSIKGVNKGEDEITLEDVISYLDGSKTSSSNKNILKTINEYASVRNGKWGPYVFYKTSSMNKPKFIKIPKGTVLSEIDETWLQK